MVGVGLVVVVCFTVVVVAFTVVVVVKLTSHRRPPRARFVARLTSRTHQFPLSAAGLSAGQGVVLIVNSR